MPTLLLTGFEPFYTHPDNPSAQAAQALRGKTLGSGWQIHSELLPVEPHAAATRLADCLTAQRPDAVLLTGLAAGRAQVTLERVAVGVMDFDIADNAGQMYRDCPVCEGGPAAYLSTLPLRSILAAWRAEQIPGHLSNSAGLYVCNSTMYHALRLLEGQGRAGVPCGFLHLPANPAVALAAGGEGMPYLPQSELTRAVEIAARTTALATARLVPDTDSA